MRKSEVDKEKERRIAEAWEREIMEEEARDTRQFYDRGWFWVVVIILFLLFSGGFIIRL